MYLERYAEAIEVLDQAIAMAPTDVRLVYALSTIYRDLGRPRPDEAKAMYAPGVLVADLSLDNSILKEAARGNF